MKKEVYLTFDLDWLADEYLSVTIDLLQKYELSATFFATHDSAALRELEGDSCEIALHPNFDKGNGKYDLNELIKLKKLYPEAEGTRSHALFFSSRILGLLEDCGMRYESNIFLMNHLGLQPTRRTQSVWSMPFNWSDDKHLELEESMSVKKLPDLNQKGLNIFNFHPVHLLLNTPNLDHYEKCKPDFNQANFRDFIHSGTGIRNLFVELCEEIKKSNLETCLLKKLVSDDSQSG